MMVLNSLSHCAIEIIAVADDEETKMVHSGVLRGAAKFLTIVLNQGLAAGQGYKVSSWFGPNVVEINLKVNKTECGELRNLELYFNYYQYP